MQHYHIDIRIKGAAALHPLFLRVSRFSVCGVGVGAWEVMTQFLLGLLYYFSDIWFIAIEEVDNCTYSVDFRIAKT